MVGNREDWRCDRCTMKTNNPTAMAIASTFSASTGAPKPLSSIPAPCPEKTIIGLPLIQGLPRPPKVSNMKSIRCEYEGCLNPVFQVRPYFAKVLCTTHQIQDRHNIAVASKRPAEIPKARPFKKSKLYTFRPDKDMEPIKRKQATIPKPPQVQAPQPANIQFTQAVPNMDDLKEIDDPRRKMVVDQYFGRKEKAVPGRNKKVFREQCTKHKQQQTVMVPQRSISVDKLAASRNDESQLTQQSGLTTCSPEPMEEAAEESSEEIDDSSIPNSTIRQPSPPQTVPAQLPDVPKIGNTSSIAVPSLAIVPPPTMLRENTEIPILDDEIAGSTSPIIGPLDAERCKRAAAFDCSVLDDFLYANADDPTKEELNNQIWGKIDPRPVWKELKPETPTDDEIFKIELKMAEILRRAGRKARFGKISVTFWREDDIDDDDNDGIDDKDDEDSGRVKEGALGLEALFGMKNIDDFDPTMIDSKFVMKDNSRGFDGKRRKRIKFYPLRC